MRHRITSLERWGQRSESDFQPAGLRAVRAGGFTGVFVNGGSGIGPDLLAPEALALTTAIPDLMPLTAQAAMRQVERRMATLAEADLDAWLTVWGASGPDQSADSACAPSNRFFDRRTKLEMTACLARHPDLFGHRHPQGLSWRGSRPLCISHPQVQAFYRELFQGLARRYPRLKGIFFFPGDADPEVCDRTCPRCAATGRGPWGNLVDHVNRVHAAIREVRADLPLYFAIWNQDHPGGRDNITNFLDHLTPGIGVTMSISDQYAEARRGWTMTFNQPWSIMPKVGELFRWTAERCRRDGRPLMVFGELCQSEVWDPACHNLPVPGLVIDLLRNADGIPGVDAVHDFWGHRAPFLPHANLAAMAAYTAAPAADRDTLLRRAAAMHYQLSDGDEALVDLALAAWREVEDAIAEQAVAGWQQRFSFAIGRDGARGRFYRALIPATFDYVKSN
jgi:hypothetical protein